MISVGLHRLEEHLPAMECVCVHRQEHMHICVSYTGISTGTLAQPVAWGVDSARPTHPGEIPAPSSPLPMHVFCGCRDRPHCANSAFTLCELHLLKSLSNFTLSLGCLLRHVLTPRLCLPGSDRLCTGSTN